MKYLYTGLPPLAYASASTQRLYVLDAAYLSPRRFFCALYMEYLPSFNKDTHAFQQRKSALTASSRRRGLRFMSGRYSYGIGTPPTLRRSASPHEVLRPCGDPAAAYASMPASSSLSSSGFLSPKSPAEFLRGRNGARGSAERQAGWRLSTRRAMSGGIYARKNRMCSC